MFDFNCAVEKHRELILASERYIWQNPETGYKEFKTSKYMEEKFRELGYEVKEYTAVDMFPRCSHVESVVLLERKDIQDQYDVNISRKA